MSAKGTRVLLIGGMGFIGRHLTKACCLEEMCVRVADIVLPEGDANDHNVEYLQGDYRDPEFLQHIVKDVDVVVHLAHDTMLLNLDCNMDIEFNRNVRPAMQLMEACSAQHVSKLLFLSSGGTVYGNHSIREPISEDSPTHPISLYGTSKLMIEQIGFLYHLQKGLPFIVARPSNAYGPGQFPYRGQGFVATAFASALDNKPLNIFGDGSVVRDFVHVRDIAEALVALIKNGRMGETYNVGTALGISMKKLVDDYISPILQEDGHKLNCEYSSARGVDVAYNVISNDKLYRDTGFKPRISLDEGLRETLVWLQNNYSRFIGVKR